MRHFSSRLHLFFWTLLVLCMGYALAMYHFRIEKVNAPSPIEVLGHDVHQPLPVVHMQEINQGSIIGTVGTGARFVIGEHIVLPRSDRSFKASATPFLVNMIDVRIPRGALFVASKQGAKYYIVDSHAGNRLVPQNRIYFRSAGEAEALGYAPGF